MELSKGKIFESIPAIMGELEAIGRDKENKSQGFKYRGIDDLYNALQPLLAKHKVFTVPVVMEEKRTERQSKSGGALTCVILKIKYIFYASDGSSFEAVLIGEGMDSGDKASNKAESIAHKYALTQVFAVRTEDLSDPDAESPGLKNKAALGTAAALSALKKAHEGDLASDAQRKKLFAMLKDLKITEDYMRSYIRAAFKKESTKDLTKDEMRIIFEDLAGKAFDR